MYIWETNAVCGICSATPTATQTTMACMTDTQYAICNGELNFPTV